MKKMSINPVRFLLAIVYVMALPRFFIGDSSSNVKNQSEVTNTTDNVGFQGNTGSTNFVKGSNNSVVDGGAIKGAFDAVGQLIGAAQSLVSTNAQSNSESVKTVAGFAQKASEGQAGVMANVVKYGLVAAAAVAIAKAWKE